MSLRDETNTKLGAAVVALTMAEKRLRSGSRDWPEEAVDMTPHEIEEACARIAGIKARIAAEIVLLIDAPTKTNA